MATQNAFKFPCPHCGQHFDAEYSMIGMTLDCPVCGQSIMVRGVVDSPQEEVILSEREAQHHSQETNDKSETVCPTTPVITVIRKRERFADKCKNRLKAVGIGVAILLLFSSVGIIKKCIDEDGSATTTNEEAKIKSDAKIKAVMNSIECLLNYIDLPNERRLGVLSRSLESCPEDFQDAVIKYLDSNRKTINDFMTTTEEDLEAEVKRELYRTIRPGSPVDIDPRLSGLKNLAVAEAVANVKRMCIESAKSRLETEIENSVKHIIGVVEKYGIDPSRLENAIACRLQ